MSPPQTPALITLYKVTIALLRTALYTYLLYFPQVLLGH